MVPHSALAARAKDEMEGLSHRLCTEVAVWRFEDLPPDVVNTTKLFVLDTNVLMHDPTSLFRFEEHDLYVPMATLEELDNNKKGMSEVARNARQASRYLDELVTRWKGDIADGIALEVHGDKSANGRLFLQTEAISGDLPARLAIGKSDNQILAVGTSADASLWDVATGKLRHGLVVPSEKQGEADT